MMEENIALGTRWVPIEKIELIEAHADPSGTITHCLVSFGGERHTIYGQVARGFMDYRKQRDGGQESKRE